MIYVQFLPWSYVIIVCKRLSVIIHQRRERHNEVTTYHDPGSVRSPRTLNSQICIHFRNDCKVFGASVLGDLMFPTPPLPTESFHGHALRWRQKIILNREDVPFELRGQPHVCV